MTARPQDVALLPCPFCGSAPERDPGFGGYVKCPSSQCPIGSPVNDEETLWVSESAWRQQAALASAQAQEDELRAEVEAIAVELDEFADCPARVLTLAGKLRALSTNAAQPGETNEDAE